MYGCMIFKYFDTIPNNSPAIILRSLAVSLAFLYTAHRSVVGRNGPCCSMCSATVIEQVKRGKSADLKREVPV